MSVVARIVDSASGGIAVSSVADGGTRFDIMWPLLPPQRRAIDEPQRTSAREGLLTGRAVLVVDDNPAVVEVITELLEQAGAEVGPCLKAADALAAIEEDPDAWFLMVTDFDMPELDGVQLAARVRQLKPDLPILLCTALPKSCRSSEAQAQNFDAIIGKPVSIESLLDGIEAAIQNRTRNH